MIHKETQCFPWRLMPTKKKPTLYPKKNPFWRKNTNPPPPAPAKMHQRPPNNVRKSPLGVLLHKLGGFLVC